MPSIPRPRNVRASSLLRGVVVCALMMTTSLHAQYTILHNFTGAANDGSIPKGSLTLSGSTIYGMTSGGGNNGDGAIFEMNADGSNFGLIHSFAGNDGSGPYGSLTLVGSALYGMTTYGGGVGNGTIFKMNTNGSGFSVLHTFNVSGGAHPYGNLTFAGSTLYGMTPESGNGTIFSISTNGTYTSLHTFQAGASDGAIPYGSLIFSGTTLYGMTYGGGGNALGTIFKMNPDGTGFSILHSFSNSDGYEPYGSLTLSGDTLYGMTGWGGAYGGGTIFSMNTNGTGYSVLQSFNESAGEGRLPEGSLTLYSSKLYGMTYLASGYQGTLFEMDTDGTDYTVLHRFNGINTTNDGAYPQYGSLTMSGSTLYGMTSVGGLGSYPGNGVVFSYELAPEPSSFVLSALGMAGLAAGRRRRSGGGV